MNTTWHEPAPAGGYEERYENAYRSGVPLPWDLPGPTPFVVALEAAGGFRGAVLDAGCGTGENALFLAARGHAVTGLDISATALDRARAKAAERGLTLELARGDACDLGAYAGRFDTVLDSGLFHNLYEPDQDRYVAQLHLVCRPGAVLHLLCMSDDRRNWGDVPWKPSCGREGVGRDRLLAAFSDGWRAAELSTETMTVDVPAVGRRERAFWLLRAERV
ncbi:class I SAM-dependent methyltransferase [Actinomadura sp. ATCC 31491]|uniref:Class I SAM-dependent methyltransferase n=1 Tax=Actinomadura luzonensis TaxID=2805427 RepID=A0ABT0G908_9ACTN|nr:class I SAM-dependent methyltransferase [Actinomadura luzonensis]MCK2221074.1 class I SAM-dependent methyltransferase [Actinomadura luzonensis]